ncbi:PUA-like domain-containing protein [Cerioporus squamosus]|nr:PUA-like domain-containing protein [Cerioporus squamosus]
MGFNSKPAFTRTTASDVFGHIPGIPVGSTFENRLFLHHTSVHTGIMAGIAGSMETGCYSIVMSGGYEDDVDNGYHFIYTGCGGRDRSDGEKPRDGPQTCDQSFENSRNASLRLSAKTKKPVRVVRGYKSTSDFAPTRGYRYDGLYVVEEAWLDVGKSGFRVCKFRFRRLSGQPPIPRRSSASSADLSDWEPPKHFWKDTVPSVQSSTTVLSLKNKVDRDVKPRLRHSPPPPVGRTRPSPPVLPIPPTLNVAASRSQPSPAVQSPASPSEPNVLDLLAEWNGSVRNSR